MKRRTLIATAQILLLMPSKLLAGTEYVDLKDEPSRADLFKTYLRDKDEPNQNEGTANLAIPDIFRFPADAIYDRIEDKPRNNSIFGVDISHYTTSINFGNLREQSILFVQAKASQGSVYRDAKFPDFWRRLGQLPNDKRLYRGAYHFLSSEGSGKRQAENLLSYLDEQGGVSEADMPVTLDLEWDPRPKQMIADAWSGKGSAFIIDTCLEFAETVKTNTGRNPILYTCSAWFSKKTIPIDKFSSFRDLKIWIADYNPKRKLAERPKTPGNLAATSWQFTDRAKITVGHSGPVDASVFYGTEETFRSALGIK